MTPKTMRRGMRSALAGLAVVDPSLSGLVVVFNASTESTTQTLAAAAGDRYRLHPVQRDGQDPVVRTAAHDARTGQFTVPARAVAVLGRR